MIDKTENKIKPQEIGIYLVGFFSLSLQTMIILLIPLYAVFLNASPFWIGIAVSAFSILPMFFSIKSGSMVDRIGSKRIICTGAVISMIFSIFPPLIPAVGFIIFFQLIIGQVISTVWIASQTYITKMNNKNENRKSVAVFSFMASLGTFIGPMLTGFFWDMFGSWGGFLTVSFWALGLYLSTLLIDQKPLDMIKENEASASNNPSFQRPYGKPLRLICIPVVLMVLFGAFLRLTSFSMRGSFYLVYLEEISLPVMSISFLYSLFSLVSSASPFFIGLLTRLIDEKKLLFVSATLSLASVSVTPLFNHFWSFFALALISGFFLGVTLPILISIPSKAVETEFQGTALGLREMSNRFASVLIPFIFGLFVQHIGLEASFFTVGGLMIVLILLIAPILLYLDHQYMHRKNTAIADKRL